MFFSGWGNLYAPAWYCRQMGLMLRLYGSYTAVMRLAYCSETAQRQQSDDIGTAIKMTPFTFPDGTYVPANNWIVLPQQALMKDSANYPDPERFDGFHFVTHDREDAASESRFSHPSWRFGSATLSSKHGQSQL